MLYKKNAFDAKLDNDLFVNPTAEYRSAPFWGWNCKLDAERLEKQLEIFKEMGYGGAYMHVRRGMVMPKTMAMVMISARPMFFGFLSSSLGFFFGSLLLGSITRTSLGIVSFLAILSHFSANCNEAYSFWRKISVNSFRQQKNTYCSRDKSLL